MKYEADNEEVEPEEGVELAQTEAKECSDYDDWATDRKTS